MKVLNIKPSHFFKVLGGTSRSQVAEMVLSPGTSTGSADNKHHGSDQILYVIAGRGLAVIEGKQVKLDKGTMVIIEAGEAHEIKNEGKEPLQTVNIYSPPAY